MPELPEVETARQVVELAVDREIVHVQDGDTFTCRPHRPGEIAAALTGARLTTAHRRGKSMWCQTRTADGREGPSLGLHLGMGGRIVVTGPGGSSGRGGGDPHVGERAGDKAEWTRFALRFADGGALRLFDKRRLGRVRLDPDVSVLGPDAGEISREDFRRRVARSTAPIKARLLDQSVLAGVGNLLADELLWQVRVHPARRSDTFSPAELDEMRVALRRAIRSAIRQGGVHTGTVIAARNDRDGCPRCGAPMTRGTVGGRTTWWCSREQRA